jgi:hypothetical protein
LNSSSPGSSGTSAKCIYAAAVNDAAPVVWRPHADDRPVISVSERLQVRMGASGAAMSVSGTLIVEELGKNPNA